MKKQFLRPGVVITFVILLAAALYGGLYYYGPCGVVPVQNAREQLNRFRSKWLAAFSIATHTEHSALSGPLADLQTIQRETAAATVPPCLHTAKTYLSESMAISIEGFSLLIAAAPAAEVNRQFTTAVSYTRRFVTETSRITTCAPFCPNKQ